MRIMKRILLWACLLALMGCGKSIPDNPENTIGRDSSWFPLQLDSKATSLTAFTDALVQEIGHLEHIPLHIVNIDWIQLFQHLDEGTVGSIFTSLTPNLLSEKKYTFSEPVIPLGPVLIVPADSEATSLADLAGKIVSVYQYDESSLVVQEHPTIVIRLYQNMPSILEDLSKGVIDAVLMPVLDARSLVYHLYPLQLKIITEPLSTKAIRLITLKDENQALLRRFNRGLKKVQENGTYDNLRRLYKLD